MNGTKYITDYLNNSIKVKQKMLKKNLPAIRAGAQALVDTYYKNGGTVFTFGNGGSAADAQHITDELLCMLRTDAGYKNRFPLPAQALTTDSSVITAIANDIGFEYIFSRQIEALAKPGDLIIGISTSGNSQNVINALRLTKSRGVKSIALTGNTGGVIVKEKLADIIINIPHTDVAHIQEGHESSFHMMCDMMEKVLFSQEGFEI